MLRSLGRALLPRVRPADTFRVSAQEETVDLVAGVKANDHEAWRDVVRAIGPSVLGYARSQGSRDPDEVLGQVLLELVRGIVRFEGDLGGLRALAIRIAHSRIVDEHRRNGRRLEVVTADVPERPSDGEPVDDLAGSEWVAEVLEQLPADHRDIILLRVIAGLSVEETAAIVGKRAGAVRVAQHRALTKLRDRFGEV